MDKALGPAKIQNTVHLHCCVQLDHAKGKVLDLECFGKNIKVPMASSKP